MRARFLSHRRPRHGVALILTLAFIVLLTILVVSFVAFTLSNRSATASYARSIQAQEIAQGGMQDILYDLHQEIVSGSTNYTTGNYTIYVPTTNYTAMPARAGYSYGTWNSDINNQYSLDCFSPSLVRVSRVSQDGVGTHFYPAFNTNSAYYNLTTAPQNRASAANTATPSFNGRYISAARWNKTFMLAPSSVVDDPNSPSPFMLPAAFATNYTPLSGSAMSTTTPPYGPPDWVYVSRGGSRICKISDLNTSATGILPSTNLNNLNTVVGRYAYIVYDEGALLDVNSAGFNQTSTNTASAYLDPQTGITHTIRNKSYIADADISILTGSPVNWTAINNFISWRNAGGMANNASASSPYMAASFANAQNGFLSFTAGDSPLLSRHDLINYFASIDSSGFNTSSPGASRALPYLSTFTRFMNAPSWFPQTNAPAGGVYNYKSNMEVSTGSPFTSASPNPNRDLANVRWPSDGTVAHYLDDGTSTNYTVTANSPMLQTRFSLARLAFLNAQNPASAPDPDPIKAAAVQACFGLVWDYPGGIAGFGKAANGGNKCWNYVGSTGSVIAFPTTIETLDQVAAEGREPNFFEMLKAVILNGSLGKGPGQAASNNGTTSADFHQLGASSYYGPGGLFCYSYDGHGSSAATAFNPATNPDFQIIQIGANIIDQYDSDSYPTAIYFKCPGVGNYDPISGTKANPIYGPVCMVYGDENLPVLHRIHMLYTGTNPPGNTNPTDDTDAYNAASGGTTSLSAWYQPELWNPHMQPTAALPNVPHNFQIRAYGSMQMGWGWGSTQGGAASGSAPSVDWFLANNNTDVNSPATINFTDSSSTSSFYANPFLLTWDSIPSYGAATVTCPAGSNAAINFAKSNYPYYSANNNLNHFVAFWAGTTPASAGISPYNVYWTMTTGPRQNAYCQPVNSIGSASEPLYCNTYALGWVDGSNNFHPYSYITGAFPYAYDIMYADGPSTYDTRNGSVNPDRLATIKFGAVDPRTSRFSIYVGYFSGDPTPPGNTTLFPQASKRYTTHAAVPNGTGFYPANNANITAEDWAINSSTVVSTGGGTSPAVYYSDPDGIVRPGDGIYGDVSATGLGQMLFSANGSSTALASGDTGNVQNGRRPVILNRPFRSVGELGYVFRDEPFKTLDFFTPTSADAGLLDAFSVTDETKFTASGSNTVIYPIVSGRVNINNSPYPVIQAILMGAAKKESDPAWNINSSLTTEARTAAVAALNFLNPTTGPNPMLNRSEIVTRLINVPGSGMGKLGDSSTRKGDRTVKSYIEAPVRALADITDTRTWNLMIDIIAQSGRMAPTATKLDDFIVEGEKRYWLHISIDRYTGKILDQQLEPDYE